MTLIALSLTSSQFGPRLLLNFMSDATTQMVLGTFVSTLLYCLLILGTVRRAEEPHSSPTCQSLRQCCSRSSAWGF